MAQVHISPQKKVVVYTRNFANRLIHWTTFFSVVVLLITGYYIGNPVAVFGQGEAYDTFVMADIRYYHFIAAMVLDVSLMLWVYLAFFSMHHKYWRDLLPTLKNIKEAMEVRNSYFTFKKPKFYPHFDPFDGMLFLLLIIFMFLQMITGFQIYVVGLPPDYWFATFIHLSTDWVEWIFGSHQNVRMVHHLMEWIMISGIIVHIYLQVAKTIIWQDGHIGQIVGGYKYKDVK